jgi:peroxiredoxin
MEAYRDQYATIFDNGRKVVVLAVSADADTTLAAWARESSFPFLFASDTARAIGARYGSLPPNGRYFARNVFVIAPDGRIAGKMLRFNVMSADAYTELGRLVAAASGGIKVQKDPPAGGAR